MKSFSTFTALILGSFVFACGSASEGNLDDERGVRENEATVEASCSQPIPCLTKLRQYRECSGGNVVHYLLGDGTEEANEEERAAYCAGGSPRRGESSARCRGVVARCSSLKAFQCAGAKGCGYSAESSGCE